MHRQNHAGEKASQSPRCDTALGAAVPAVFDVRVKEEVRLVRRYPHRRLSLIALFRGDGYI